MCSRTDDPTGWVNQPGTVYTDGDGEQWVVGEGGTDRPATPHEVYIESLIERVEACRRDGGAGAQVAALAVRGIVRASSFDPEWRALLMRFGAPSHDQWAMAYAAYGTRCRQAEDTGDCRCNHMWFDRVAYHQ